MTSSFTDSRSFTGMKSGQEQDSNGASLVESVLANDLRVGKHCMIGGFPCKIRELNRAAPGKHGHAKLRTVGQGIFDGKKRETSFIAQHVVQVPVIQSHQAVQCVTTADGFQVMESDAFYHIQRILSIPSEDSNLDIPNVGKHVLLSVVIACGHYKITKIVLSMAPEAPSAGFQNFMSDQSQAVLSKKDIRKRKKQLRKLVAAASVSP